MSIPELKVCGHIGAIICAQDGVISMAEEARLYEILCTRFNGFSHPDFNELIDEFFNSSTTLENYASLVTTDELKHFIVYLCSESASADGLDIRENFAMQKLLVIWDAKSDE